MKPEKNAPNSQSAHQPITLCLKTNKNDWKKRPLMYAVRQGIRPDAVIVFDAQKGSVRSLRHQPLSTFHFFLLSLCKNKVERLYLHLSHTLHCLIERHYSGHLVKKKVEVGIEGLVVKGVIPKGIVFMCEDFHLYNTYIFYFTCRLKS